MVSQRKNLYLSLASCLAIIALSTWLLLDNAQKTSLLKVQGATLEEQGRQIQELTADNPNTLEGCLDRAAVNYANEIKANGTLSTNPDQTTYYMSMDAWKKLDDQLQRERQACQAMHGH